ncbi:hypothetical protein DPMN_165823 [Dreissena polymorpha]|uniref:Uncharacterized protein n=1 Tax=Dreissena polymorpha TaxID=45954 RepID=A0A9D4EXK3_DREPO|nr:hypothetical protein DPMN_165823 [Dreissena polymorpha]
MTKFHEDWTINVTCRVLTIKTAPSPGGHIFQQTGTIFQLCLAIIRTNVLTTKTAPTPCGHTNVITKKTAPPNGGPWTKNKTSRVLTMFYYSHITKTAPLHGGYVFQLTRTIFELS